MVPLEQGVVKMDTYRLACLQIVVTTNCFEVSVFLLSLASRIGMVLVKMLVLKALLRALLY